MFAGADHDVYNRLVGACHAYEVALKLPDTVDLHARQLDEHRSRAAVFLESSKQRTDLALAGSGWWDRRTRT